MKKYLFAGMGFTMMVLALKVAFDLHQPIDLSMSPEDWFNFS